MSGLSSIMRKQASSGFTIVELLIVIVIIGILAAIVIVAYNGIQTKAQTNAIYEEMVEWKKLFQAYKAINGTYPNPSPGSDPLTSGGPGTSVQNYYCLGTGFPGGNCLANQAGNPYRVAESTGTALISQLSTVGSLPPNSTKYTYDSVVVGPYLWYQDANTMYIQDVFPGGITCPSGTVYVYSDAGRVQCQLVLN